MKYTIENNILIIEIPEKTLIFNFFSIRELEVEKDKIKIVFRNGDRKDIFENDLDLSKLDLSARTKNSLRNANIHTYQQLLNRGLTRTRNFGIHSFKELKEKLNEKGLEI